MKILVVYAKDRGGGFFRRVCRLIEALGQNGDEVHYISISEYPLKHTENIHFHKIPIGDEKRMGIPEDFIHVLESG